MNVIFRFGFMGVAENVLAGVAGQAKATPMSQLIFFIYLFFILDLIFKLN